MSKRKTTGPTDEPPGITGDELLDYVRGLPSGHEARACMPFHCMQVADILNEFGRCLEDELAVVRVDGKGGLILDRPGSRMEVTAWDLGAPAMSLLHHILSKVIEGNTDHSRRAVLSIIRTRLEYISRRQSTYN